MEFNPNNNVVKLCLQGMNMEEKGQLSDARVLFFQAWNESTNKLEKFLSAHYIGRTQEDVSEKLEWIETALQCALAIKDSSVESAFPFLYSTIAKCHEDQRDPDKAIENYKLSALFKCKHSDKGPLYHGTKADLQVGDFLTAGSDSNYKSELKMNHIYFTAIVSGAGLAAALAKGDSPERIYIIEPTGGFENDPNVTDKRFPGNPTRSYRSEAPPRIVGEVTDWIKQTPEKIQVWRERLAKNDGEIIN